MIKKVIPIEIYTDGSSKRMSKDILFGGWAYVITRDNVIIEESSGSLLGATNQQMELLAAANALEKVKEFREKTEQVRLYSDSAYLINCYNQGWYKVWMRNGWENAKKEPVANQELWWRIIPFFENLGYGFIKVKGHEDCYFNNLCDEKAQKEAKKLEREWSGKYFVE